MGCYEKQSQTVRSHKNNHNHKNHAKEPRKPESQEKIKKERAGKAGMWVVTRNSLRQSGNTLPMRTEPNLSERMAALGWLARLMLYLPG